MTLRIRKSLWYSHHDGVVSNSSGSCKAFLDFHQCLANPFPRYSECCCATRSSWIPKGSSHVAPMAISYHRYTQVREIDDWEKHIEPRGKYYFTRYHDFSPCSVSSHVHPETSRRCSHSRFLQTGNRARVSPLWRLTLIVPTCV